jgi:hypothetical protein
LHIGIGDAYVKIAISSQELLGYFLLDEILLSQFISQFYSCTTSCLPPALSFSTHRLWFAFSSPVGGKPFLHQHKPQWLLCLFWSSFTKIFSDCFSKGNLLGSLIEPETSKENQVGSWQIIRWNILPCKQF